MSSQKALWTNLTSPVCCMCEYWIGERELQFIGGVRLNGILAQVIPQGKCQAKNNCLCGFGNPCAVSCFAYKKWHKLP